MTAVTIYLDFGDQENKVYHCFLFFPQSIYHEMMGPDAMIVVFLNVELEASLGKKHDMVAEMASITSRQGAENREQKLSLIAALLSGTVAFFSFAVNWFFALHSHVSK